MINKKRPFNPKVRKVTPFDVCFDDKGNLMEYCGKWTYGNVIKEKNAVFQDVLEYDGYYRVRSSIRLRFVSKTSGRKFHMFISDFDEVVKSNKFNNQVVDGLFCFTKKGNVQGIRFHFGTLP